MRTATLDLNSRGSFVDDLNAMPGIVMCRDALLHRSHEIQPAHYDSELKKELQVSFFQLLIFFSVLGTCLDIGSAGVPALRACAPMACRTRGKNNSAQLVVAQVIKIFESNLGNNHLSVFDA